MRHGRHYVEQLMGDEPLRTIREIAIGEIESPPAGDVDLGALEASIRAAGVLQPLLLAREGRRYRVIDGASRLRAANAAGLRSVPALVHDIDSTAADTLRQQASNRATPIVMTTPPPEPAAAPEPALPAAFSEVTAGFGFASALLTALGAAGGDRFRSAVLTDFMAVELQRGKTLSTSMEALWRTAPAVADVDARAVIEPVIAALRPEARRRNVTLDVSFESAGRLAVDAGLLSTAVAGLLHGALALAVPGRRVSVNLQSTAVRPALIVEVSVEGAAIDGEAEGRFFDADWKAHPSGAAGAVMLAAAARVARLHGGRVDVRATATGAAVTFVLPRSASAS
jgi:signal transduction histidine kinase